MLYIIYYILQILYSTQNKSIDLQLHGHDTPSLPLFRTKTKDRAQFLIAPRKLNLSIS